MIIFILQRRATSFQACRKGVAAVEFALSGLALMMFIFGIVNLGMLGFSIAALNHAVQQAARIAAVQAAANFVYTGTYTCPSTTDIEGYFDTYADPPFPSSKPITSPVYIASPVSLTATWSNNGAGTTGLEDLYLTLTATYQWIPIGIPILPNGITLRASTVASVLGTNGLNVTSPTC